MIKLRLRARSVLMVTSVVMLAVALLGVLLTWQFHQSTSRIRDLSTQSLDERLSASLAVEARELARSAAARGAAALAANDPTRLSSVSNDVLNRTHVTGILWRNAQGQIVAQSGRFEIAGSNASAADSNSEPWRVTAPVQLASNEVGVVQIAVDRASVDEKTAQLDTQLDGLIAQGKRHNWTYVVTAGGLSLVCALGLALLVARQLVLPIQRLADYAAAVGLGHHTEPLPLERSDELGDLARSLRDMSDNLQVTTGEVHYLAYHDSLTQLPNRAQLKQSLRQAIGRGRRDEHSVALLFIDLDDFKRVNDTLGHDAGDALLKDVAVRLRACLRLGDELGDELSDATGEPVGTPAPLTPALEPRETIARLGGDEFTIVLNSIRESEDAAVVARRILESLREPFVIGGQEVVVGASIGITAFPEDGEDVDTLLRNADVAMYQAKDRGKNHFEFYNDSMHRMATERLSLETDLRHAINYEQMRVLYQPIVDAHSRELVGVDAQVRWLHPALGAVLPNVFIPLAVQTGFIFELDRWMINQVCTDLAALDSMGHSSVDVAASLSCMHFRDRSAAEMIIGALNENDVQPSRLALAINEKTMMRNFDSAIAFLDTLRERGVQAWIDDFGSGHSPLRVLPRLALDGLRLGSQDLNALARNGDGTDIVRTVVAMAHSLKLKVTATGVETVDQLDVLREVGCDFAQGSLFVRPMLLADLAAWLTRHGASSDGALQTGTFATVPFPGPRSG